MSIAERVKLLLGKQKKTQKEFAGSIGIKPARLNNYFAGISNIPVDILVRISEQYDCSLVWLLTGRGEMYNNNVRARENYGSNDILSLPVVADIAAGKGIEAEDVEPVEWLPVCRSLIEVPGPYFAFRVSGESMSPYIMDGDYAVVSQNMEEVDPDGLICAFRTIEGMTLKRYTINSTRDFSALVPLNPKYPIIPYDEDSPEYVIVGRLVLIIRKCIGGE